MIVFGHLPIKRGRSLKGGSKTDLVQARIFMCLRNKSGSDKIGGTNRLWDFSKLMYKSGFENNGVSCGSVNRYPFSIIELDNWLASKYVWSISFGIFLSPLEEFYKILDEKSPWDLGLNVFCSLLEFYGLWEFKLTFILIVR